jgi:uncharacterized membrane protein
VTADQPTAEDRATDHQSAESGNGLERLVFFSDAVVAIAITLVVLPLVDSARSLDGRPASVFLQLNATGLLAAAISFGVIGGFWREHHRMFSAATGYTRQVMGLNLYWLCGIMAVPVVTILVVSGTGKDRLALGLYLGVITVVRIVLMAEDVLLARANLAGTRHVGGHMLLRHLVPIALLAVALAATMVIPAWGMWPVLVLVLQRPLRRVMTRNEEGAERPPR